MAQELLTEKVITYIYQKDDQGKLKELEANFLEKTDGLAYQFSDWLAYDYPADKQQCYADQYLKEVGETLQKDEVDYIKNRIGSYLGFYEVIKIKENILQFKNIFTRETLTLKKDVVEEDIDLHEILLARFTQGDAPQIVSSNVTVLPYQFKTLLTGQVHEHYEWAKERKSYLTLPQYFKENLLAVLGIVNKLQSYKNQEADVTLHQSIYAVTDYFKIKEILLGLKELFRDEDSDEGIYQLMDDDIMLAELVLQRNRLEVECSNKEDQKTAKKILAEKLENYIVHIKDEELIIDDLI